MLRYVASFLTSNTNPTNISRTSNENKHSQKITFRVNTTNTATALARRSDYSDYVFNEPTFEEEERPKGENVVSIQSLRERKQQELAQKILLRKISHQATMSYYAQDHLPLSQIQEKLEEDNLPLSVLREKLKQEDNTSIYTNIKENINFLLYSKSPRLNESKRSRTLSTPITDDDTNNSNNAPAPKDYRDYDVWDDAVIGRLMNLVDTIGIEPVQE